MIKNILLISMLFFFTGLTELTCQPDLFEPKGIGGGGPLFSPSINPINPSNIFISSNQTALFRTQDTGNTWETVDYRKIRIYSDSKIQFTSDQNILYAIENDYVNNKFVPVKSIDAGKTWKSFSNDPTQGDAYYFYADDQSTDRYLISSYDKIFFTIDGGTSFRRIYTAGTEGAYIAGTFFVGDTICICIPTGYLFSDDGGLSFRLRTYPGIPATEGIVSFTGAFQNNILRLFVVTVNSDNIWPGMTGAEHWSYQGVYSIDEGTGTAWVRKTQGLGVFDDPFFVSMARDNINIAYLAGGNTNIVNPIVFKTTNGGDLWESVFLTDSNANIKTGWNGFDGDWGWWFGEYTVGFSVSSRYPDFVVITDNATSHVTKDGGKTWRQMYVRKEDQNKEGIPTPVNKNYRSDGLDNTVCWWMEWLDKDNVFAGYNDFSGTRSMDGGNTWTFDWTGIDMLNIYQIQEHPKTSVLYAAESSVQNIYQRTQIYDGEIDPGEGVVIYSANKGKTWDTLHNFKHPVVWVAADPNNINKLYASVVDKKDGGIYITENLQYGKSSTWKKLSNPPRTEGHPYNVFVLKDGAIVCTYSARRDSATKSLTASSGVFISTDGGTSWIDRSDDGMKYWTKDLTIDPGDTLQNTWYAGVFGGWQAPAAGLGGLYKTIDRGLTWTRVNKQDRVESCKINPWNVNEMYFTTESNGLWFSSNINSTKIKFDSVSSYPFQHPLRVFFDPVDETKVWVTSLGNGIKSGINVNSSFYIFADCDTIGDIIPKGEIKVVRGNNQTFQASGTNYQAHVKDMIIDGKSIGPKTNYTFSYIDANHSIYVKFARDTFLIKSSAGKGGKISPSGDVYVDWGSSKTFTITPDSGYMISNIFVDNGNVPVASEYIFKNVTKKHTIDVRFQLMIDNSVTITSIAGSNGTIKPSGEVKVKIGSDTSFVITPENGYHTSHMLIEDWDEEPQDVYTFKDVRENHKIEVKFDITDPNSKLITATCSRNGSITPVGVVSVPIGTNYYFAVKPDLGYSVKGFLVDAVQVDSSRSYTFENVQDNHKIKVNFEIKVGVNDSQFDSDNILTINPNPANQFSIFNFQFSNDCFVNLKIYDFLGNEIASLLNETKQAGKYNINFDTGNLPTGVYYCRLQAGNNIEIKQFVVVK